MEFTNTPMEWNNAGTEPPESLKNNGWEANQKPPANYFNAKWYKDYKIQKELQDKLKEHIENVNNPHGVTKSQVGLGNVDNTSDLNKPISTAVQNALNGKAPSNHTHPYAGSSTPGGKATSAVVADALSKYVAIKLTGGASGSYDDFDGSGDAEINVTSLNPDMLSKPVPISKGGTGNSSVDTTPTSGSTKMVTSGGVYSALQGKAPTNHDHSASQITSGTLPVARGGTGATTAAAARTNLGLVAVSTSGKYNDLNNKPYTVVSTVSELEAAVSTTSQGGKVFLLPGTYEIDSIINVGKRGVVIEGAGIDTVLKMGANGYIRFFGDYSVLRDVCITRDVASSNSLVAFDGSTAEGGYAKGVLVDNVYINCTKNNANNGFFKTVGLSGTGVGDGLKFNACTIITDESNAFIYTSGAFSGVSVIVSNCVSSENLIVPPNGTILGANINITVE